MPLDPTSKREKVLHQGSLTGKLDFHRAISKTAQAAAGDGLLVLLNSGDSRLHAHKLNIRIVGLASNTFHNDVNGLLIIVQHLGVTSKEGDNLRALCRKWNLTRDEMRELESQ